MKKTILMMALALGSVTVFAQSKDSLPKKPEPPMLVVRGTTDAWQALFAALNQSGASYQMVSQIQQWLSGELTPQLQRLQTPVQKEQPKEEKKKADTKKP